MVQNVTSCSIINLFNTNVNICTNKFIKMIQKEGKFVNTKEDRTVAKGIRTALLELLAEKPYVDITVTDIVNRAGVARISYYRHFSSVNDVVDSIVDELASRFIRNVLTIISSKDKELWIETLVDFFEFAGEKGNKYFKRISQSNMSVIFIRVTERLKNLNSEMQFSTLEEKYNLPGKLGLIESVARHWITTGMTESTREMAEYISEILILF
ncbi:MAG: TetR/AcrR family transcriptional regulator [Ruminococcaceae bacterium]|nr:TetR/AcrR family transcriptional regulator [Oscillospiraceae bacterium]